MAVRINWSIEAKSTFEQHIDYLLNRWTEKEVKRFVQQTDYILSRLQEHPELYSPSQKNKNIRKARLNKYITLYYHYYSTQKEILLLSFWNVKQDPDKLMY